MAWYRTGAIAVTNNSTSVSGAGTLFVDVGTLNPGDILFAPDGKDYEVLSIQSNTGLTLTTAYLGATASAQAYAIAPIGLLPSSLAVQVKSTLTTANTALTNTVSIAAAEGLTTTQQGNARANIGAAALAGSSAQPFVAADIQVAGGGFAQGKMYASGTQGLCLAAKTGATYDFSLFNPTGSTYIAYVPTATLDVYFGGAVSAAGSVSAVAATASTSLRSTNNGGTTFFGTDSAAGTDFGFGAYGSGIYRPAGQVFTLSRAGVKDFAIDGAGNIAIHPIGVTSGYDFIQNSGAAVAYVNHAVGSAANTGYCVFTYNGGQIGSVTQSGTTAVLYNTTSDYRLKNNARLITPTESAAFIDTLKPKRWEWSRDGRADAGFLAHEAQEVMPNAVNGTKDETEEKEYEISPAIAPVLDSDGNTVVEGVAAVMGVRTVNKYQSMQASSAEMIANIVAELQTLRKRVAELEAKLC
jgi:hypothetical protein